MSAVNMLAEQSAYGRSDGGPSPFVATNAFSGDFLGLSLPDEENLWGISPLDPPLASWNGKPNPPHMERDLKNAHVRNGQPTPPPYDDSKFNPAGNLYSLAQCQLDGVNADLTPQTHNHRRTFSEFSGGEISTTPSKRRRSSRHVSDDYLDDDNQHERAKREKFLERNRLAASKCRQKKKEHTMLLESRYKEQSDKKEGLVSEIARLRSEILGLKNEVLKHAQCGDEPIKLHLAQMVKKITYTDAAPDLTDVADAASPSDGPVTPTAQQALSFGFDDPLQLGSSGNGGALEQHIRRDSEVSLMTDNSYNFSAEDSFDDLINV